MIGTLAMNVHSIDLAALDPADLRRAHILAAGVADHADLHGEPGAARILASLAAALRPSSGGVELAPLRPQEFRGRGTLPLLTIDALEDVMDAQHARHVAVLYLAAL